MRLFKSVEDNTNKKKKAEPVAKQKHNYDFLVVDDSKFSRSILTDILKSEGYNIAGQAGDGLEAIELTKEKKPSFIFMDITMPKMDGLTAAKEILQEYPDINIIMCSALSQKKIIVEAIKSGAKDFVIKPYKKENIINVVDLHMEADKKGQVIPFRSDNHIKKSTKKDLAAETTQTEEEKDLSLDDMISKEIDIIFDSYEDENNKIDLENEPKLEVIKKSDEQDETSDEYDLAIEDKSLDSDDKADTLDNVSENEKLFSTDTNADNHISEDTAVTNEKLLDDKDEIVDTNTEADEVEDYEESIEADELEETIDSVESDEEDHLDKSDDQFDQFLEKFGSAETEAELMSLEADEDEEETEGEEEPALGIKDDDVSLAMYSFEDVLGDDSGQEVALDDTTEIMQSQDEHLTQETELDTRSLETEETTGEAIKTSAIEDAKEEIEDHDIEVTSSEDEVTDEADKMFLDESTSLDNELEIKVESLKKEDIYEEAPVTIPDTPASEPIEVEQQKTVASAYADRFGVQPENVNTQIKENMKMSRIGASQLLSKPLEIEPQLDYDFETLYSLLSAYICIENRFSSKNMQFKLENTVKSKKKVFANSLNKDRIEKKSISMLNVYRKDIFKKEAVKEKIDESLLAAVTSLVRTKGTRILGNNKFSL